MIKKLRILYGVSNLVYADNAATTKLDIDAFEAMKPFLLESYGNASQPYSFGVKARRAINKARKTIAECIGADPEEIYFTSGGTESDNWAIKIGSSINKSNGSIITSQIEHHAILHACNAMEREGKQVKYLPVTHEAVVLPESLEEVISSETSIVSVMTANNEVGSIQPIKELAAIAHKNGALFHTDAVQAVGHIPINVKELDVDMLSASAHKFNGPKGIGFLYVKKGIDLKPFMDGGAQERGMRAGTENVASIVGMAVALKNNCMTIAENREKLEELEKKLILALKERNINFLLNGSIEKIPGNISLSFDDIEGEILLHRLDIMGICVSTGSACDSKNTQISHVLSAMNLFPKSAKGTIRLSFSKDNTLSDISEIVTGIQKVLATLR